MWQHNVDLLAYHDLGGRSGFKAAPPDRSSNQIAVHSDGFVPPVWPNIDYVG